MASEMAGALAGRRELGRSRARWNSLKLRERQNAVEGRRREEGAALPPAKPRWRARRARASREAAARRRGRRVLVATPHVRAHAVPRAALPRRGREVMLRGM